MKTHDLKIHSKYDWAVEVGIKTFECRKNDRNYHVGDILRLREWLPEIEEYTGREVTRRVTYILKDGFGLPDGYCVMAIKEDAEK